MFVYYQYIIEQFYSSKYFCNRFLHILLTSALHNSPQSAFVESSENFLALLSVLSFLTSPTCIMSLSLKLKALFCPSHNYLKNNCILESSRDVYLIYNPPTKFYLHYFKELAQRWHFKEHLQLNIVQFHLLLFFLLINCRFYYFLPFILQSAGQKAKKTEKQSPNSKFTDIHFLNLLLVISQCFSLLPIHWYWKGRGIPLV